MRRCKLGEIADICLGKMLDKEKNKGDYQPYLANINVRWGYFDLQNLSLMRFEKTEQGRYGLKYGDIVMCEGGEPGRCAIWRDEIPNMKIQKALHRIRVHSDIDSRYIYYWFLLAGKNHLLDGFFIETTIKHLTADRLKLIELELPSYAKQKSISDVLEKLDKKILLNNRVNATLEEMAKTLYDYWFVQFDFPDEKGRPYKTSGGKMVYNEELGREIPAGWEVVPLPQVASLQYGYPLSTDIFCNEGIPVIRIRDIIDNSTSTSTNESVHVQYLTEKGDLLVGMDGNFQMNYWTRDGEIVNQRITRIRKKEIPIMIIRFQIEPFITAKITNVARSTVGHLSDPDFKERLIIAPSNLDMSIFDTVIDRIISYRNENRRLAALRDWLLPMLMNGQVGWTEAAAELSPENP